MTVFRILCVCTANICRSPVMERLLASRLSAERFVVESAGVRAVDGSAIDEFAGQELSQRGLDAADFHARRLTAEHLSRADLVLTATMDHRAEALAVRPAALHRTFTLLELADLVERIDGDSLQQLVRTASTQRYTADGDRDIADPYGRGLGVHARTAQQIEQAVETIAQALGSTLSS